MKKEVEPKDLVQIIRDNPGAVARIDNDYWVLEKPDPYPDNYDEMSFSEQQEWDAHHKLATSEDNFIWPKEIRGGCGFASHTYGGHILQALAIIAGIKVEGV